MHFEIGRCLCKCVAIANIIIITNRDSFQLWKCTLRNVYVKITVAVENSPFHHQAQQQNFTFFPHCCYDRSFSLPYHSKAPPCPHLQSTCFAAPHSLHPPPVSADPFHNAILSPLLQWYLGSHSQAKEAKVLFFKKKKQNPKGLLQKFPEAQLPLWSEPPLKSPCHFLLPYHLLSQHLTHSLTSSL